MKKQKLIIIFIPVIIFLIIALSSIIVLNILPKDNEKNNKTNKKIEACNIKKEKCSIDQVKKGVKVNLAVNNTTTNDFYVIEDNDSMVTLISTSNLKELSVFSLTSNMEGPTKAFEILNNLTSNWDKIDFIPFYLYSDYGLQKINYYEEEYDPTKSYDAFTKNPGGYSTINILDGQVTITEALIDSDVAKTTTIPNKARARLITYEELEKLMTNEKLPTWLTANLNNNEGFWTMSTALDKKSNSSNAYAVIKANNNSKLEGKPINNKLYINPVITISRDTLLQNIK